MSTRKNYMEITPLNKIKNIDLLYNKGLFIFDSLNEQILTLHINEDKSNIPGIFFAYKSILESDYILEYFISNNNIYVIDYVKKGSKEPYILRYSNIISKFNGIDKYIHPITIVHTYERIDLSNYKCPIAILSNGIYKFGLAKENKFYLR